MSPRDLRISAIVVCLLLVVYPGDAALENPAGAAKSIDGLWRGSWGGGRSDGAVMQPVIAELLIKGDHVELCGFRNPARLSGTVRLDPQAKRMYITPAAGPGGQSKPRVIEFTYEITADQLTLTDPDNVPISFQRRRVEQNPLANVQIEALTATGINDAGELHVTEYRVLKAGPAGGTYYEPQERKFNTKQATVFLAQEAGLKKVAVDEARARIRQATPVVVIFQREERPSPHQFSELYQDMGAPMPNSEAVQQTLSRLLRPGTLVFVLPASESIPQP